MSHYWLGKDFGESRVIQRTRYEEIIIVMPWARQCFLIISHMNGGFSQSLEREVSKLQRVNTYIWGSRLVLPLNNISLGRKFKFPNVTSHFNSQGLNQIITIASNCLFFSADCYTEYRTWKMCEYQESTIALKCPMTSS